MLNSKKEVLLNFLKGKNLLITTHNLADLDALASGIVLQFCFERYFSNQNTVLSFSGLSKATKSFVNKFIIKFPDFSFSFQEHVELSATDVIIIVDSNNLEKIKMFYNSDLRIPFIFIDHHLNLYKDYPSNLPALNLISDNYSSTSEIVLELIDDCKVNLPIPYKYLLVSAILTDSGFLKHGNTQSIRNLSKILQDQIEIQDVFQLLEREQDISEKIARIKALQRVKLIRIKNWLIGVSHLSSFTASAASILTNVGFDIGIVVSEDKSSYRITTRAKKKICLKTGLHLGKIISEIKNVNGGGHDGAATLNGKNDVEETLNQLIDKIKETLIN